MFFTRLSWLTDCAVVLQISFWWFIFCILNWLVLLWTISYIISVKWSAVNEFAGALNESFCSFLWWKAALGVNGELSAPLHLNCRSSDTRSEARGQRSASYEPTVHWGASSVVRYDLHMLHAGAFIMDLHLSSSSASSGTKTMSETSFTLTAANQNLWDFSIISPDLFVSYIYRWMGFCSESLETCQQFGSHFTTK